MADTDISKLFANVAQIFPILNNKLELDASMSPPAPAFLQNVSGELQQLGISDSEGLCEFIWLELCSVMRTQIVPKFWAHFELDMDSWRILCQQRCGVYLPEALDLQYRLFQKFITAVTELHSSHSALRKLLERLQQIAHGTDMRARELISKRKVHLTLRDVLLAQLPVYFNHVVHAFYSISFRIFTNLDRNAKNANDVDTDAEMEMPDANVTECEGCNVEIKNCRCKQLMSQMNKSNDTLVRLDLLDRLAGQSITGLVQVRIREHVALTCFGNFDQSHLKRLEAWLDSVVISWLARIFNGRGNIENADAKTKNTIEGFKVKLTYFLYEFYAQKIIEQFFSIIIDFPDSIPAIDDLKICMDKIDMRNYLIKTLKASLQARILHPGVNTMDILTGYVAAIKAIRHLDGSGVILEIVTAPIKEYLRKRSDTVRRVVTGLTEEGPSDLSEELAKGEALKENMGIKKNGELVNWERWEPDPFGLENAIPTHSTTTSRSADIISMVVDIYGSKELFMNEYRNLMADRLLTQLDYNPEKELRNLELLKLRFGETLLHSCEVMLKDVADSKRINSHIHSDTKYEEEKQFDISSLIVSAQFWPSFNKESLELPEEIANEFRKYTKSYEAYKGNRTLQWRTVTGRVQIEVELGERTIELTVPPTQAVIIYHFQHKNERTLEELSSILKLPTTVVRRRITFWQTHGIISEVRSGVFKLIEDEVAHTAQLDDIQMSQIATDEEDIESAMASSSDQREEELQVFWSYIVGMLTNLDSLPIERIHQMLKLFASHGLGIEFTQDELKDFLQRKVREHKLLFSGGVYQLAK